ncbi:adhesion G-protein coupled receptor G1 isoform X2 [Danio rerio]
MSGQKLNVLRLIMMMMMMILCCLTGRITCVLNITISTDKIKLNDVCLCNSGNSPAIQMIFHRDYSEDKFNLISVNLRILSRDQCSPYSSNFTNNGQLITLSSTVLQSVTCQTQGLEISLDDVVKKCRNAPYSTDLCNQETSAFIVYLEKQNCSTKSWIRNWRKKNCKDQNWSCVKCIKSRVYFEEMPSDSDIPYEAAYSIHINDLEDENGDVIPSNAADSLDFLESDMMDNMENNNESNAMIVMGNVTGILQIQDTNTQTEDMTICYSSNNTMVIMSQNDMNTGCLWTAIFPSEAFNKSRLENNGSAFVGVLRFTNMGNKNQTKNYTILNNEVYGITMGANIANLTNNIEITFTNKDLVGGPSSCTSWNGKGNLEWTTTGCETKMINSKSIKCSCSHLTFFAVLMSPVTDANAVAPYLESLTLISAIGCGISVFFLAFALFIHFLLRKAKSNQATKILINMFGALFLLNVSFLSNESVANSGDKNACVFIALLMHYSMLTTFTWFFIQALHMYLWLIRQNVTITNYMRKITVLGWGFSAPAVIAVVSVGGYNKVTLTASSGKIAQMCWITNPLIHYVLNTGYYIFVFIFTIGIFITILTRIIQSRRIRATEGKRQTFRKQLMMVLSLFLLFGLTWAVAFFSYGPMLIPSYYIFCALNSFQGFFLFLYYYHIHKDAAGHFSDDPKSSGSVTTIVPPDNSNNNAEEHVYDEPH